MDMVRNLAAASSIASGIPSSARQTRTIVDNVVVVEHEILAHCARPVPQQLDGGGGLDLARAGVLLGQRQAARPATAPHR